MESFWEEFGAFDSLGLKLLIHFLKRGNSYHYELPAEESVWESRRNLQVRCPSLFSIPPVLWEDTEERKLVVNGTLAAVFQVHSRDAAKELLGRIVAVDGKKSIDERKGQVVKRALDELNIEPGFIYIKIQTTETIPKLKTSVFRDIWTVFKQEEHSSLAASDFLKTYPVEPPSFSKCSFIVMQNRGESLRHVNLAQRYGNFARARPRLLALKSSVDELGEFCFHGAILPHNVAVDEAGKLTLFDYDEALFVEDTQPQRRIIRDQVNDYRRLSYPNILRSENKKEYSFIQFSLIVRFVAEALSFSGSELENLVDCHQTLAGQLERNVSVSEEMLSEILQHVEELVTCVDAILAEKMDGECKEDEGESSADGR